VPSHQWVTLSHGPVAGANTMKYRITKPARGLTPTAGEVFDIPVDTIIKVQEDSNANAKWVLVEVATGRHLRGFNRESEMMQWLEHYATPQTSIG
jgi:hypothetical protein